MKKLFVLGIMALSILCIVGAAASYTYDSSVDPIVFTDWKILETKMVEPGVNSVVLENDNSAHKDIKYAIIYMASIGGWTTAVAYEIFQTSMDTELLFELNPTTDHYD